MIYLPEFEKTRVVDLLYRMVDKTMKNAGFYPLGLSIRLPKDDFGDRSEINFILGKENGVLVYESIEELEIGGVPSQKLRIPAQRPGEGRRQA